MGSRDWILLTCIASAFTHWTVCLVLICLVWDWVPLRCTDCWIARMAGLCHRVWLVQPNLRIASKLPCLTRSSLYFQLSKWFFSLFKLETLPFLHLAHVNTLWSLWFSAKKKISNLVLLFIPLLSLWFKSILRFWPAASTLVTQMYFSGLCSQTRPQYLCQETAWKQTVRNWMCPQGRARIAFC